MYTVITNLGCGILSFESWVYHWLAIWPWPSYIIARSFIYLSTIWEWQWYAFHINAEWDNAYKILETWLSGKCPVTLVFLAEVFLTEVLLPFLSTRWTLRFLNSSCVLQLGSLLPFTEPHIWLCPKKRESRGVTPSTCLHLPSWTPTWEPELDLDVISSHGCYLVPTTDLGPHSTLPFSFLEGGTYSRERERRELWLHCPSPCFPVAPDALAVAMAVGSRTTTTAATWSPWYFKDGKNKSFKESLSLLGTGDYAETLLLL